MSHAEAHACRRGTYAMVEGQLVQLTPSARLVASKTTQLSRTNKDAGRDGKEMPKGGSAIFILDDKIRIHQAHTGNGFASAVMSRNNSVRFAVICAYNPPKGSVLNNPTTAGTRNDASSHALFAALTEEVRRLQPLAAVVYLFADFNLRFGTMGGTRLTADSGAKPAPELKHFCERSGLFPVAGDKEIMKEFPGNAIGDLTSRAITGSSAEGVFEIDAWCQRGRGPSVIKTVALRSPIRFSDLPDSTVSHLPAFIASQLPHSGELLSLPRAPVSPVMPHVTFSDSRFVSCSGVVLQLLQHAADEKKSSEDCYRYIVGGLQRIVCGVFAPARAEKARVVQLDELEAASIVAEVSECMKNNMPPAARKREKEKQLKGLRAPIIAGGKAKAAAAASQGEVVEAEGAAALEARQKLVDDEAAARKQRQALRRELDEAIGQVRRLELERSLLKVKASVSLLNSRHALELLQAEEQEDMQGVDPHTASRLRQERTSVENGFIEATAGDVSQAVMKDILTKLKEDRPPPPLLGKINRGEGVTDLPLEVNKGSGDNLDNDLEWTEVALALFPEMEEIKAHWKEHRPVCAGGATCELCRAYARDELRWPRLHTSRAAGSDGTKAEILEHVRPPSVEEDSSALFEFRRDMSIALSKILNRFWSRLPSGCDFRHSVLTLLKKKPAPGKAFDPDVADSYRNIACGNTLANLLQVILATRLQHWLVGQRVLSAEQAAFVPQLSCEHLVLVLTEVIKMKTSEGLFVAVLYLDISRAYDDVHLALLFAILRHAGAGEKFCTLLSDWFNNRTVSIKGDTTRQHCNKGLPQGSPIAPALWNVLFDTLLKRLRKIKGISIVRRRKQGAQEEAREFVLRFLAYADDLVITVEGTSIEEVRRALQEAVEVIAKWAFDVGLRINTKPGKTEAMIFPPHLRWEDDKALLTDVEPLSLVGLDGHELFVRFVDQYKYLGFQVLWNLDMAAFRKGVLAHVTREINRHFAFDPVTRRQSWSAQSQVFNSLVLGQTNYMTGIIPDDAKYNKDLGRLLRRGTRIMYCTRGRMGNLLLDLETSGSPVEGLSGMHQIRFFRSIRHLYRTDYPIRGLYEVQEFDSNPSCYRQRLERLQLKMTKPRLGLPTGIFKDDSSIKAVKRSAKELRVTFSRGCVLETGTDALKASPRLREASALEAAERCRAFLGVGSKGFVPTNFVNHAKKVTQELFVHDLYCVGIGETSEHCLLPGGGYRLSMPGPGIPTLTSADKRLNRNLGAVHFLLRMHRQAFNSRFFMPRLTAGRKMRSGLHAKLAQVECPLCEGLYAHGEGVEERLSSPMHLMLSCKHAKLRTLQAGLRSEAADVFLKAASVWVSGMKSSRRLTAEEKTKLDSQKARIASLCQAGGLGTDCVDANNVIYRMMALVPFSPKLAAVTDGSAESFPLIAAFGSLFDSLSADRGVNGGAATLLISWTTGWMLKFAQARLEVLGEAYFFEPSGGAGGAAAVCEDTESEPDVSDDSEGTASEGDSGKDEPDKAAPGLP